MFESIAALSVVLGAIVLLRVVILRLGLGSMSPGPREHIRVLESRTLGVKQQIHLVEVDGCRLLLGATESGISRLTRLPDAPADEVVADGEAEVNRPLEKGRRPRLVNVLSAWLGVAPMLLVVLGLFFASDAMAQQIVSDPQTGARLSISIDGVTAPEQLSDTLQIVLILTAISVAPSILLMATCFTRILIVLALLRQAIGAPTLPPTQVLVGLALMTTFYVMTPVGELIYADSLRPYMDREISGEVAMEKGLAPVRDYLMRHTREDDLMLFVNMRGDEIPEEAEEISFSTLMPAFMISEVRTAFEIGFMIYLPFLVVDLVIASMLISLGMIMLPPVMIALPFKLMLFVLVDGWNLTLSALVAGLQ